MHRFACSRLQMFGRHLALAVVAMGLLPLSAAGQSQPPACAATQRVLGATGAVQQFVVPGSVTSLTIDAAGGQGGGYSPPSNPGGSGARLVAVFSVAPGETLNVVVGGSAAPISNGGGGGSFVYRTPDASGLLLAAAGGGGASASGGDTGFPGSATTVAGSGDGGTAGTGGNGGGAGGSPLFILGGGGGGGLLTDGGSVQIASGGKALVNGANGGTSGGGFGGGGGGSVFGAGGGGGYNGGGGGVADPGFAAAGGGGGSFVNPAATATLFAQNGIQTGDGRVSFCYAPVPATSALSKLGMLLLGGCLGALALWSLRRN